MGESQRIVVLGGGYAGLTCFLELQDHLPSGHALTLVNDTKYHWFTTELHTYAAGEEGDTVRIPLFRVVKPRSRLIIDNVVRIHPGQHQVELSEGKRLDYDLAVFALGSDAEFYGLPGVEEHAILIGNWHAAAQARERLGRLLANLPEGRRLSLVVAGGGLTGVEVAGELADQYPDRLDLTILEAGSEIMGGFPPELVQRARQVLAAKRITIQTGNPIVWVEADRIHLKNGDTIPYEMLIWAAGVRGSAILTKSGLEISRRGRGIVDQFLHAQGYEDLYIIGDSASFVDPATGREVPPTGQAAVQMGKAAGQNILRRLRGEAEEPFQYRFRGAFASLGRGASVGHVGKSQLTGWPAMLIKDAIEFHHIWETGAGLMPLVSRLLRAPGRFGYGRFKARRRLALRSHVQ